jgi:transposase
MKHVLASSTGTGGDTVRRAFARPTSRQALLEVDLPLGGSRTHNGRASAYICRVWTVGACSLSSKRSRKPTPRTIFSSCSMVLRVIAQNRLVCPENVDFVRLPAYSPELDPVERWFEEFRRELSNRAFETVELVQEALGQALRPYWEDTARLRRLTGFSWWVEAVDAL